MEEEKLNGAKLSGAALWIAFLRGRPAFFLVAGLLFILSSIVIVKEISGGIALLHAPQGAVGNALSSWHDFTMRKSVSVTFAVMASVLFFGSLARYFFGTGISFTQILLLLVVEWIFLALSLVFAPSFAPVSISGIVLGFVTAKFTWLPILLGYEKSAVLERMGYFALILSVLLLPPLTLIGVVRGESQSSLFSILFFMYTASLGGCVAVAVASFLKIGEVIYRPNRVG